jgi:hypothetical protein
MNTPQYPNLEKGQWIFTCKLTPLQFSHIEILDDNNRKDYAEMNDEDWNEVKYDSFVTIEGSHHSKKNCNCKLISEAYAQWFIKNQIHLLYEKYRDVNRPFESYEVAVRTRCLIDKIEFEGI